MDSHECRNRPLIGPTLLSKTNIQILLWYGTLLLDSKYFLTDTEFSYDISDLLRILNKYFVLPETLTAGGRNTPIKGSHDAAEGLFFKADGQWKEVSRDECKQTAGFQEANCYAGMGQYFL